MDVKRSERKAGFDALRQALEGVASLVRRFGFGESQPQGVCNVAGRGAGRDDPSQSGPLVVWVVDRADGFERSRNVSRHRLNLCKVHSLDRRHVLIRSHCLRKIGVGGRRILDRETRIAQRESECLPCCGVVSCRSLSARNVGEDFGPLSDSIAPTVKSASARSPPAIWAPAI